MRRGIVGTLAVLLVLGIAAPTVAASKIKVRPNPVEQGERLKIKAKDCISGDGYEAFVEVEIVAKGTPNKAPPIFDATEPADDDGTTLIKAKIRKAKYPPGTYIVYVWCIHEFDDGSEGIWYKAKKSVTVVA